MEGEDLDTYLDRVLVGGRERRQIAVVDYDPSWPDRFQRHKTRITAALGPTARRIEHIGSTAVPDLAAKPIVDIVVAIDNMGDDTSYGPALERAGYVLRVREEGHQMFRTPELDVHIHIWPDESAEITRHLLFRDWLRFDLGDRRAYEELKRSLAQRDWEDMNHYANAKTALIADIMVRAETWARSSGWTRRSSP
jgi:GrpB-like predicted nucleotidyltransferase (UPF0157 family)